jgi:tetratricopeptide (TPR) repeat protein
LYTAEDRDAALLECSLAFRADKKLAFRRTAKPDSKLEELTVESRGPNDLDHGDAAVLLLEGIEAVKDNDLTCAVVHYRSAIQLDRKYAHAHKNLGDVLRKLDKRDDALAEYDQAVALDPAYAYAYNSRGLLLFEAGNMADSASAFAKAVERAPNVPVFHNNLALTFARAGMTNDAFNAYIDMEKKWPSDALTHLRLGKLFEDRGELTIAKEQYKLVSESSSPTYASSPDSAEVIDLADLFAEPHLRLGKILLQEKKQDEALVEFQNVLNRPFRTGFDTEVSLHIARITIALLPTDDNSQRYVNSLVEACNTLIYGSKGASADFSEFVDLSGQVDRLFRGRDHCNLPRPVTEIAEKVPPTTPSGRPPSDGVPSECKTGDPSPVRSKSRLPVGPPRPINPW